MILFRILAFMMLVGIFWACSRNTAARSPVTIIETVAPSGAKCYVIYEEDRAVGGNCL